MSNVQETLSKIDAIPGVKANGAPAPAIKPESFDKAELLAKIEKLEAAIAAERAKKAVGGKLSFKVGEKGGVSVYGLGRFPQTLYYEQWKRLLGAAPELDAFLEAHKGELSMKGDK